MSTPVFELTQAAVCLGRKQVLHGLNLCIQAGEVVALVGSNGSGKTTLLRLLHGMLTPSQGEICVDASQRQAMLFQRPFVLRCSVLNNVAWPLWWQSGHWSRACAQAQHALRLVGLSELAQRPARALSGGQQQRLALARAWALRPQVLLLDEPTAHLDPQSQREVEALMAKLAKPADGSAMTVIFSSHNLGQVKRLAQRVIYMEAGQALADMPAQEFFNPQALQQHSMRAHLFVQGESA